MVGADSSSRQAERQREGTGSAWEVASALLRANDYTTRALEEHMLAMSDDGQEEPTREHIERALERHRRIVEELEYALEQGKADESAPETRQICES